MELTGGLGADVAVEAVGVPETFELCTALVRPGERVGLRSTGGRFVTDFERALGRPVEFYSVSAAQATEILLDAIAKSDGTRAAVRREVFKTNVRNGILGSFSFNANGDTTAGSVTVYKVLDGKPKLVGLITPSPALVR